MQRGRPIKSKIRQNILEILFHLGSGYGYQICKIYNEIFPPVTQRSIYYHLRKGLQTKEIAISKIEQEQGNFSWGPSVEKTYYELGRNSHPLREKRVKEYLQSLKQSKIG